MPFTPRNESFASLVRENFGRQRMMQTLKASLRRVVPGEVDIEMPYATAFCQQNGFLHAGTVASIADSANGYAALTLSPPNMDVLAVEFKINLLAPAEAPHFVAEARVIRSGRTLTVCRAQVYGLDGARRTLVAEMLSTIIQRPIED